MKCPKEGHSEEEMCKSVRKRASQVAVIFLDSLARGGAQAGGELRFLMRTRAQDLQSSEREEDASRRIRYLRDGVLVRVNRQTQDWSPS